MEGEATGGTKLVARCCCHPGHAPACNGVSARFNRLWYLDGT
jgi:hypothetical protein